MSPPPLPIVHFTTATPTRNRTRNPTHPYAPLRNELRNPNPNFLLGNPHSHTPIFPPSHTPLPPHQFYFNIKEPQSPWSRSYSYYYPINVGMGVGNAPIAPERDVNKVRAHARTWWSVWVVGVGG